MGGGAAARTASAFKGATDTEATSITAAIFSTALLLLTTCPPAPDPALAATALGLLKMTLSG